MQVDDSTVIVLNRHEIGSRLDRVRLAELLLSQLPATHDGRNTWLLNYGTGDEAKEMRDKRRLPWHEETRSAMLATEDATALSVGNNPEAIPHPADDSFIIPVCEAMWRQENGLAFESPHKPRPEIAAQYRPLAMAAYQVFETSLSPMVANDDEQIDLRGKNAALRAAIIAARDTLLPLTAPQPNKGPLSVVCADLQKVLQNTMPGNLQPSVLTAFTNAAPKASLPARVTAPAAQFLAQSAHPRWAQGLPPLAPEAPHWSDTATMDDVGIGELDAGEPHDLERDAMTMREAMAADETAEEAEKASYIIREQGTAIADLKERLVTTVSRNAELSQQVSELGDRLEQCRSGNRRLVNESMTHKLELDTAKQEAETALRLQLQADDAAQEALSVVSALQVELAALREEYDDYRRSVQMGGTGV